MLSKDEIKEFAQSWFGCDEEQAEAFAKDLDDHQTTKIFIIDWLPNLILIIFGILYIIFHW